MTELGDIRCVVLGGGGFIGTNLCRALQGRVRHLRAFGRSRLSSQAINGVEWIQGDLEDLRSVADAIDSAIRLSI
jgi:UDP-glucose 4-epimerase